MEAIESTECDAWYKNGKLHRIGGPAKISFNMKEYYYEGKLHREDGPAVVYNNSIWGDNKWYINGEFVR